MASRLTCGMQCLIQVKADKVDMVRKYIGKALEMNSWGEAARSAILLYT